VAETWKRENDGFVAFLKHIGPAPDNGYVSVHRIDPTGDYVPDRQLQNEDRTNTQLNVPYNGISGLPFHLVFAVEGEVEGLTLACSACGFAEANLPCRPVRAWNFPNGTLLVSCSFGPHLALPPPVTL
jgi:hypothetical protein